MKHSLLDINLAIIWDRLLKIYQNNPAEYVYYDDLYNFFKFLFLKHDHKPFISDEMVEADPQLQAYYNNYKVRIEHKTEYPIDFFEYAGNFYDMAVPCFIDKSRLSKDEYKKIFHLALDTFKKEELPYFLLYQFQESNLELSSFNQFLLQLSEYLNNKEAQNGIDFWIKNSTKLFSSETNGLQNDKTIEDTESNIEDQEIEQDDTNLIANEEEMVRHPTDSYVSDQKISEPETASNREDSKIDEEFIGSNNQNRDNSETAEEEEEDSDTSHQDDSDRRYIPGYQILNIGDLTTQEIEHFFSFLYHKSDVEEPFLSREQVAQMLENGIKLPETPLANKFKLKISPRKRRRLADYFFYKFYTLYNPRNKRKFLQYLGAYIEDYAKALDTTGLENLRKNFTGKEPESMFLKIEEFLPERSLRPPVPLWKQIQD